MDIIEWILTEELLGFLYNKMGYKPTDLLFNCYCLPAPS